MLLHWHQGSARRVFSEALVICQVIVRVHREDRATPYQRVTRSVEIHGVQGTNVEGGERKQESVSVATATLLGEREGFGPDGCRMMYAEAGQNRLAQLASQLAKV